MKFWIGSIFLWTLISLLNANAHAYDPTASNIDIEKIWHDYSSTVKNLSEAETSLAGAQSLWQAIQTINQQISDSQENSIQLAKDVGEIGTKANAKYQRGLEEAIRKNEFQHRTLIETKFALLSASPYKVSSEGELSELISSLDFRKKELSEKVETLRAAILLRDNRFEQASKLYQKRQRIIEKAGKIENLLNEIDRLSKRPIQSSAGWIAISIIAAPLEYLLGALAYSFLYKLKHKGRSDDYNNGEREVLAGFRTILLSLALSFSNLGIEAFSMERNQQLISEYKKILIQMQTEMKNDIKSLDEEFQLEFERLLVTHSHLSTVKL